MDYERKKVTIREVAELAGVSISSVSRYLADPKSIQPLAAYNIKNAINELQYEPNMFARNLKRGQTQIVGLIVPHMEYFFGKICHVVSDYFLKENILLISVKVTVSGKRAVLCPGASEPESRRNHNCTEWTEYTISAGRNKEL